MTTSLTVYDPTAPERTAGHHKRRTLDTLKGKVAGFIDNAKPNYDQLIDAIGELLVSRYGVKSIVKQRKHLASIAASKEAMSDLTRRCDFVIVGLGD